MWEVAFQGLPLYPLGRYYLFEGHSSLQEGGYQSLVRTNYRFVGRTRLKPAEVLGPYVWGWLLCPAAAGLTIWLLIELYGVLDGLDVPEFLTIGLFLVWLALLLVAPIGVLLGMTMLRGRYQRLN